ncbi:MAG: hypothetical protein ACR2NU_05945 [Aeoliella sp.]
MQQPSSREFGSPSNREARGASTEESATVQAKRNVPVLARIPWLVEEPPTPEPVEEVEEIVPEPLTDAAMFRPHRIVASADLGVASYGESSMQWRVDPPQSKPAPDLGEESSPDEQASPAELDRKAMATDEVLRASVAEQVPPLRPTAAPPAPGGRRSFGSEVAPRQTLPSNGGTQWRFDPPETAAHAPQTFEQTERSIEPSNWHQRVAAIDNGIRRYHRVIVLAALITAAGLMMLVLEGQRTPVLPAPETLTPAASNSKLPTDNAPNKEAEPEQMRETHPLTRTTPEARGPGGRARPSAELVVASPSDAPSPITPIEPHREPHSVDVPAAGLPYVSTGAPEIVFTEPPMPRALFSGKIQPVPQQAKHDQHESSLH